MTTSICPDCQQDVPFEHDCKPRDLNALDTHEEKVSGRSARLIPSVEPPTHYVDGRGTSHALIPGDKWVHPRTNVELAIWVVDSSTTESGWLPTKAGEEHIAALQAK